VKAGDDPARPDNPHSLMTVNMRFSIISLCCILITTAAHRIEPVRAQTSADITLETIVTGLDSPLYVTHSRDQSGRLFIVEQPGRIKVLHSGSTSPSVFLDIVGKVLSGGERGLLGLAFHPQFESNRRFFVNYTRRPDGATVIAEYRASASNPDQSDATELIHLSFAQPFANHNGGMLEFGPDGFLYIGTGDGGSANDPGNRAQNVNEFLGKILRIDVDHPASGLPYSSPSDNPFVGPTTGRDEIYAYGLRNPWRFSFDRVTGQLYAGDVGQGAREEIDIINNGGNYGWRVFEGTVCTNNDPGQCSPAAFTPPIAEYNHAGGRCSITGGYVYRGSKNSLPFGSYVFADFCTGEIFLLQGGDQSLLMDTSMSISSFGEGEDGEIYVVGLEGTIRRITNPNAVPPGSFGITSAFIRKRSNGVPLDPLNVRPNGKKFEIVIHESSSVPVPESQDAMVLVNGVAMNTEYITDILGTPDFVARLRRPTLATPGALVVEVLRVNGSRSNRLTLQLLP
jgi:glucose/arabinose dehydrogenase